MKAFKVMNSTLILLEAVSSLRIYVLTSSANALTFHRLVRRNFYIVVTLQFFRDALRWVSESALHQIFALFGECTCGEVLDAHHQASHTFVRTSYFYLGCYLSFEKTRVHQTPMSTKHTIHVNYSLIQQTRLKCFITQK